MKSKLFFGVLFITSLVFAKPLTGEVHVKVPGMVCSFCVQGLTKVFKKQEAVEQVHVSLEGKFVHLVIKKDQSMDSDKILNLIKDAGYEGQIGEK